MVTRQDELGGPFFSDAFISHLQTWIIYTAIGDGTAQKRPTVLLLKPQNKTHVSRSKYWHFGRNWMLMERSTKQTANKMERENVDVVDWKWLFVLIANRTSHQSTKWFNGFTAQEKCYERPVSIACTVKRKRNLMNSTPTCLWNSIPGYNMKTLTNQTSTVPHLDGQHNQKCQSSTRKKERINSPRSEVSFWHCLSRFTRLDSENTPRSILRFKGHSRRLQKKYHSSFRINKINGPEVTITSFLRFEMGEINHIGLEIRIIKNGAFNKSQLQNFKGDKIIPFPLIWVLLRSWCLKRGALDEHPLGMTAWVASGPLSSDRRSS